ncbi:UNVERIFIED_ORG: type 1 fimbria pilin [Providencia alcalifaciens]
MFNKSLISAALVVMGMSSMANAADAGHGKVTFTGSIIDAPCSITPDSIEQTVELGQISKVALTGGGQSTPRNFSIALENCSFGTPATKNKVNVTFTGMESSVNNELLGVTGTAKGVGIALTQLDGSLIKLGTPTKDQVLQDGNNTLTFAAYVKGSSDEAIAVTEGDFQSVTDFTLSYN